MLEQNDRFVVYGGTGHHKFDNQVLKLVNEVTGLRLRFSQLSHSEWPDGEPDINPDNPSEIAGKDVIFFTCPITNDLEIEMKDILNGFRQFGAKTVTVVMSFLRYRRQDRINDTEVTRLRWFIRDLVHWGVTNLIVCDPHSVEHTTAFCQENGLKLYIADPTELIANRLSGLVDTLGRKNTKIYSPDLGSLFRSLSLAKALGLGVLLSPKQRHADGEIEILSTKNLPAETMAAIKTNRNIILLSRTFSKAKGMNIIMREDEVDTATTSVKAANLIRSAGALRVYLVAIHPVCSSKWKRVLLPKASARPFDGIYFGITRPRGNSIDPYKGSTGGRVTKIKMAPVVARELIRAIEDLQ